MNKGGKFLKKLWCCVGGEYKKIIWFYQLGRRSEGLRLETSAFEFLYGGQFTLSTQLIKPNYLSSSTLLDARMNIKCITNQIKAIELFRMLY